MLEGFFFVGKEVGSPNTKIFFCMKKGQPTKSSAYDWRFWSSKNYADCRGHKQKHKNQQITMPVLRPSDYSPMPKNMAASLDKKVAEVLRHFPVLYDLSYKDFKDTNKKNSAWEDIAKQAGLSSDMLIIYFRNGDCNPNLTNSLRSLLFTRCFLLHFSLDFGDCLLRETSVKRTGAGKEHFDWFILRLPRTTPTI